jgi:hypothetical protein
MTVLILLAMILLCAVGAFVVKKFYPELFTEDTNTDGEPPIFPGY